MYQHSCSGLTASTKSYLLVLVLKSRLPSCRGLQHLDVRSNQLQAATCAALGHVVSAGCQLLRLRLDSNPLSKQASLAYSISVHTPSRHHTGFICNQIICVSNVRHSTKSTPYIKHRPRWKYTAVLSAIRMTHRFALATHC